MGVKVLEVACSNSKIKTPRVLLVCTDYRAKNLLEVIGSVVFSRIKDPLRGRFEFARSINPSGTPR